MSLLRYVDIVNQLTARRGLLIAPARLPDEHELANEYGVARDTVRRALKVLEEQEAVVRRRRRGTFLQPLVACPNVCRGHAVGFVPPWWADSTTVWCTSTVFEGVSRWADEQGCSLNVLHAQMHEDQDRFAQRVRERNLAGVVWLHPQTEQVPIIRRLAKLMPVVVVGRHVTGEGVYSVTPDYVHAARLIDDHLVGLGHSTYAAVGTDLMGIYNAKWLKAIEEAHAQRGQVFDYTHRFLDIRPFARQVLSRLLLELYLPFQPEIQALVLTSSSYLKFLAADVAFRDRVGRDLSVVTIDFGVAPIEFSWPYQAVDHIVCDWQTIGRQAISLLGQVVEGQVVPECKTMPVSLKVGETCTSHRPVEGGSDLAGS